MGRLPLYSLRVNCRISKRAGQVLNEALGRTTYRQKKPVGKMLSLLILKTPPETYPPKIPEKIQWVKLRLVCEVAFAEWTEDEQLRQTTFLGWRDDKTPTEAVLEQPK
jgi:ATP-dependent DNA ligase